MKRILVVAAHADDEILGAGGSISRHAKRGDQVNIVILCPERGDQAEAAAHAIGAGGNSLYVGDIVDQKFDSLPILNIIKSIEHDVNYFLPDIVYTHWIGDLNKDHEITARAVLTACRPLPNSTVKEIYGFEVLSSTEWSPALPFVPNHFVELSVEDANKKMAALQCYKDEMRPIPHARSERMASETMFLRGSQVGVKYAEAFHVYRSIRRI